MSFMTRNLGKESGVQLNAIQDDSTTPTNLEWDQVIGLCGKFLRGPIHRPFVVTRSNLNRRLGNAKLYNTPGAYGLVFESLKQGGAQGFVVQRMHTGNASIGWALVQRSVDGLTTSFSSTTQVLALGDSPVTLGDSVIVISGAPVDFLLAVKHLECHSDGIQISYHADEKRSGGELVDNDVITLRIHDSSGNVLWRFTGSLDSTATDSDGKSFFLPDVVAAATDLVEVQVGVSGSDAVVKTTSDAYGYNANRKAKWPQSGTLYTFSDSTIDAAYTASDYSRMQNQLANTNFEYGYLSTAGSDNISFISMMIDLAYQTNCPLNIDIPGDLTYSDAIEWYEQLALGGSDQPLLYRAFWAPVKRNDPIGIGAKGFYPLGMLHHAYACHRNSFKNVKGLAAKHYPIAGRGYPIAVSGATQVQFPDDTALSQLASANINPVKFHTYSDGSFLVFYDALTAVSADGESLSKLVAAAEMAVHNDTVIARKAADLNQLPLEETISQMSKFLAGLFSAEETSSWLVPSDDPDLEGSAYRYSVTKNQDRPYDAYDVSFKVRYCGTARAAYVSQTISR
jgi:hypothetical protein